MSAATRDEVSPELPWMNERTFLLTSINAPTRTGYLLRRVKTAVETRFPVGSESKIYVDVQTTIAYLQSTALEEGGDLFRQVNTARK
jgi:hypothetical protein